MTNPEAIRQAVTAGSLRYVESQIRQALEEGTPAETILSDCLLSGMRDAGNRYRDNDVYIPQILSSARCMRAGVELLRPHLQQGYWVQGKVILGTVAGDLHDIGKNLVGIMIESTGVEVVDLGVDVPAKQFVRALYDHPDASVVCLSCLLTTCRSNLTATMQLLRKAQKNRPFRIVIGGGAVNRQFADSEGADAYTEDAVEAAEAVKQLILRERGGGQP